MWEWFLGWIVRFFCVFFGKWIRISTLILEVCQKYVNGFMMIIVLEKWLTQFALYYTINVNIVMAKSIENHARMNSVSVQNHIAQHSKIVLNCLCKFLLMTSSDNSIQSWLNYTTKQCMRLSLQFFSAFYSFDNEYSNSLCPADLGAWTGKWHLFATDGY